MAVLLMAGFSICSVDGCPKPAKTRGWCSAHYERWRRNGDPGPAGDGRKRPPKFCVVCGRRARSRSAVDGSHLCSREKWREEQYGSYRPDDMQRPHYGEGCRRYTPTGYVEIYAAGHPVAASNGMAYEHRVVAWDAGILTDPSHAVHHKNEIKDDNRPENLEAIPRGEHQSQHLRERGYVRNQYGVWPVGGES